MSKDLLGLNNKTWLQLTNEIKTIYHNGASVNYLFDYDTMRDANVKGTSTIIHLATTNRLKEINHISTTFIFGWSAKKILYEKDRNQDMQYLDFGYSQSKWVSEQLIHHAIHQGVPGRIFRPALISPSIEGYGFNFDISIRLLDFMLKYGIGTHAKNQVSFTPSDIAANNIIAISRLEQSINQTFNVTRDDYATLKEITDIMSSMTQTPFTYFELPDFVPRVIETCTKDDLLFPLLNFLVKSVDNISNMEFKRYDNSQYKKYRDMSEFGINDPPLKKVVKGILLFMEKQNCIKIND